MLLTLFSSIISINLCNCFLLSLSPEPTSFSIKGFFKERVYDTIIPRLVRLAEAPSHGKPILEYEPRNKGTIAYLNLAKEVIERNGTKEESVG